MELEMTIYGEIAKQVHEAAKYGNKIAMFHYQVLMNAPQLGDVDPIDFCRDIGVPDSYATEFRKILSLARLIQEQGYHLEKSQK
jgi:hypothetical protein